MRSYLRILVGLAWSSILFSCASPYQLEMTSDTVEKVNGKEVETAVTPQCVFQAGNEKATSSELLVFVKVTNKSDKPFDFDPATLQLFANKDVIKNSPLTAKNPETYAKELSASAEVYDRRTKMESYQGVDELAMLNEGKSDREIEEAKRQYKDKKKEADDAKKTAEDLRARSALIGTTGLRKSTIKPGESVEGPAVFKSEFEGRGVVHLDVPSGPCESSVKFRLARPGGLL